MSFLPSMEPPMCEHACTKTMHGPNRTGSGRSAALGKTKTMATIPLTQNSVMQGLAIGLALGQFFSQLIVVEQNIIEVPFMIKLQIKHILTHLVTRLYNVKNIS